MKRFMIFAYDSYYPSGGMHDFQADFDTIEEAQLYIQNECGGWQCVDIYDSQLRKKVS